MTWHWSYKTLPELAGLPDAEKRRAWQAAHRAMRRHPGYWASAVAVAGLVVTGMLVAAALAGGVVGSGLMPLVGPAAGWVFGAVGMQGAFRAARPYLLRELPGRCHGCGYDLTGNASGACPECGRAADAAG